MSRSNVPVNQPGGWPPNPRGAAEVDTTGRAAQRPQPNSPYGQAAFPGQQPHGGAPAPQGYPQQPAYGTAPAYPAAYPAPQSPSPYADPGFGRPAPLPHQQQPQQPAQQFGQRSPGYAQQQPYAQPAYPSPADVPPSGGRGSGLAPQGQSLGGAPNYAPQFDPYVPQSQPAGYGQQQPANRYAPQQQAFPAQQPQQPAAFSAYPQPSGFEASQQRPAGGSGLEPALAQLRSAGQPRLQEPGFAPQSLPPRQSAVAQPDNGWRQAAPSAASAMDGAHGFDLGNFSPSTGQNDPTTGRRAAPASDLDFGDWPARPQGGPAGYGQQQTAQPGFEHEQQHDDGYAQGYEAEGTSDFEQAHDVDDDDAQYDYEQPKKRSSLLLVGGALVASVIVGSGLAFVYQMFLSGQGQQTAAVIKTDSAPAKVKPAEPGGKQFANTDSKVMGRLNDSGSPITTASTTGGAADGDPAAPRKVSTIAVGRDGSLAAPAPTAAAEPGPGGAPAVSVPGLTLVDGFGGRPPSRPTQVATAPIAPSAQQPMVVVPPPSVQPVVTARAAPPSAAAAAAEPDLAMAAPDAPAAPVKKPAIPKKKVVDAYNAASATVPAAGTAPAPVTTASTGANGFVPVLASVPVSSKSRMDALKQFADMQQKYGGVLGDKTPDVQEANLGEKGTYHRLLAGPPGSREQASQVCTQLKAAGYSGCWVTAY